MNQWGKAILSGKFAIQFCTTTPNACSDERLWNADSCFNNFDEWNAFLLHLRFPMYLFAIYNFVVMMHFQR